MLIKDYAEYRSYYCGLCKTLGKRYSQLLRLTVNYDITFLTLLAHNYRNEKPAFKMSRCILHPIGRKFSIVITNPTQELIADYNIILGYYKLYDDVLDGGKIKHKVALAALKPKFKKASKRYPGVSRCVKNHYEDLRKLEKAGEIGIERLSDCFAKTLVDIGESIAGKIDTNLEKLCYYLGKWIYVIDAYDDLLKDLEEKSFNPLNPTGLEISKEMSDQINTTARDILLDCIKNIRDAYDAMDIVISEGPLSNVIYCGLRAKTDAVLKRRGEKCKKTLL